MPSDLGSTSLHRYSSVVAPLLRPGNDIGFVANGHLESSLQALVEKKLIIQQNPEDIR